MFNQHYIDEKQKPVAMINTDNIIVMLYYLKIFNYFFLALVGLAITLLRLGLFTLFIKNIADVLREKNKQLPLPKKYVGNFNF
jgi:hypothetical protein